jgi:hypothetical protein
LAAERRLPPKPARESSEDGEWSRLVADPWTVVTVLVVALTVRAFLAEKIVAPWIMVDELIYSELAKSVAESGELLIRGEHTSTYSLLYPLLIAPAWLAHSMEATYALARIINALLMTLAAVPLYLWARRLVSPGYALLVLGLFLLMPSLLYAGTLMTENAFLPAFLFTAFAFAFALERPTLLGQALALGMIALAAAVRVQGLVLVPVLLTSILVMALLESRGLGWAAARSRLARFLPTLAALALAIGAYVVVTVARGAPLSQILGAYQIVAETDYSAGDSARWVLRHFGELGFSVALVPVLAFIVLLGCAARGTLMKSAGEQAFLAVTCASVLWFPAQSGIFASRFADRIEERAMMYVAPLLLLALVIWLARGLPRPAALTAFAVALPSALLLALPLARLLKQPIVSDTFALVPLLSLRERAGMGAVHALVWLGVAALAALFAAVPTRPARALVPLAVAGLFAVSSVVVGDRVNGASRGIRAVAGVGGELSWLDREIGRDGQADLLYTANVNPHALWQLEFWNRSVEKVLALDGSEPGGLPRVHVSLNERTGELGTGVRGPRYVVVPHGLVVSGQRRATRGPWQLYRVDSPLRLQSVIEGVSPDGWMGREAVYTVYGAAEGAPSSVEVVLSRRAWGGPDVPGEVRIDVSPLLGSSRPTTSRTGVIHSAGELRFVLRAPALPFRVRLSVDPTFSPSDFGYPDDRELGAIPSVRLPSAG